MALLLVPADNGWREEKGQHPKDTDERTNFDKSMALARGMENTSNNTNKQE